MERRKRPARRRAAADKNRKVDSQAQNNAFVAALKHPTRRQLLKLFLGSEAALSPKELADLTGEKLPTVSYHVRVLADKNTIELTEEEPVRGSVAHFYRPTVLTRNTAWVLESLDLESPKS